MAVPFLIVDGYNLLHAVGLARVNYAPGDLERQRQRLLAMIAGGLSTEERQRCTVVFDAIEAPSGADREFEHDGIAVLFAKPGHEADELIEELVARHPAARNLIVVSSDHRLQRAARVRRAGCLDCEAFAARLSRRSAGSTHSVDAPSSKAPTPSSPTVSNADMAHWLREFGAINVDTIAAEEEARFTDSADPWQQRIDDLQRQLNDPDFLKDFLDDSPEGRPPERR